MNAADKGFIVLAFADHSLPGRDPCMVLLVPAAIVVILLVHTAGCLLRPMLNAISCESRVALLGLYDLDVIGLVVLILLR